MSRMNRIRGFVGRLFGAVSVGLIVAGLSYILAFNNLRGAGGFRGPETALPKILDAVKQAIETYRKSVGRLPSDLGELKEWEGSQWFEHDAQGRPIDPWGKPIQYRVDGDGFVLFSFGRDGRAGGVGIDADLYPSSSGRPLEKPTFRQFAFQMKETRGVWSACIFAGLLAAATFLMSSSGFRRRELYIQALCSAVGAIIVSIILTALEVPSGH